MWPVFQALLTHVPYSENSQAVTDLLGGQIPIMFMTSD